MEAPVKCWHRDLMQPWLTSTYNLKRNQELFRYSVPLFFLQENIHLTNLGNSVAGKCQITCNKKKNILKLFLKNSFFVNSLVFDSWLETFVPHVISKTPDSPFLLTVFSQYKYLIKEVQKVYRLFLVNYYLLHGNIYSETEADRDISFYYLRGRFSDSLNWLYST